MSAADLLQPAGGGTAVANPDGSLVGGGSSAPAAAPKVTKSTGVKTTSKDLSSEAGIYKGTVYDKSTGNPYSSDAQFQSKYGFSSKGIKFDTSYLPSVLPSNVAGPVTGSQLEQAARLPDPVMFSGGASNLSDRITVAAQQTMTSNQQNIDTLQKQREDLIQTQKDLEKKSVDALTKQLDDQTKSTIFADAKKANDDKFKIDEQIATYTSIQNKILDATSALQQGLIYEGDRPVRMQLLSGRQATLKSQGIATIGALQGAAAVIKGNIDMAQAYGNATIDALKEDSARQASALSTLLTMHNNNLVTLSKEEQNIIDSRLQGLKDASDTLDKNKNDIMDLMTKYPDAFVKGSVNFTDTKETAYHKIEPFLAARDREEYALKIAKEKKSLTTGTGATKAQVTAAKSELLSLKTNGMTYEEAINGYADTLDPSYIASVYGRATKDATNATTASDLYGNFVNSDGTPKPGYKVTLDSKGKPQIANDTGSGGGGFGQTVSNAWSTIKGWFGG